MTELWTIDPTHTDVEFAVKHMMIATVKGRFSGVSGTIEIDRGNPDRSKVEVEIDAATIDTRVADRDTHLRSADFLEVETHPTIAFRSTRVSGGAAAGEPFEIEGELTIRGETRAVVLDATFEGRTTDPWGNDRAGFTATGKIDRRDWGLTWNAALETGGMVVGHDVKIAIELEAVRQVAAASEAA